jgi:hypothetical protein
VHAAAAVQDTLERRLPAPLSLLVWRIQLLPFHPSATVESGPSVGEEYPTERQFFAEVHETPVSSLERNPAGLGVVCMLQTPPVLISARLAEAFTM